MGLPTFIAYLRTLGWKLWTLTALMLLAIFFFFGWPYGLIIVPVVGLALIPAVRFGMRAEAAKSRPTEER